MSAPTAQRVRPSSLIDRSRASDREVLARGRAILEASIRRWLPKATDDVRALIEAKLAEGPYVGCGLVELLNELLVDGRLPDEALTARGAP